MPRTLPSVLIEQAHRHRDKLREEVSKEVAAETVMTPVIELGVLRQLAEERDAILACLKRLGQIGIAGHYFGIPVPSVVLGLLIVFLVIGEVADEILQQREADLP